MLIAITISSANINGTELYYLKDGHGNVMRTVEPDGTSNNYYIYDAFGNVLEKDYDDVNPFGYCGEYLDSESGLVYLRNRYYDSTNGRFITEDPIKDGMNWYAYCNGNPVAFVDHSGLTITLSDITSKDDARFVALQNLTDDILDVDFETGIVSYAEGKSIDREVSTNLIRDIINDDMDCEIIIYDESNGNTTYTCDSESNVIRTQISFNPDYTPSQWAYVDGEGYGNRTKPNFMVMGHELVHVVRRMQGEERDRSNSGYYLGGPEPGETLLRKGKPEELETVGIDYVKVIDGDWTNTTQVEASKFYYSENTLRLEYDRVHQNDYGYVKMGRRAAY